MNKIRTRLLELFMEELRLRDQLTGRDRLTLYHQFREVLEQPEGNGPDADTVPEIPVPCGIPSARVGSYTDPAAAALYQSSDYRHS